MPKKGEYVKFKNYERKIKSQFIIYANFESTLLPQDNGRQNPGESYANRLQNHLACSYSFKLVCVDDKFSKPFKTYLGKKTVYSFINSMIEECKYCSEVMKKLFNKELVITKEENEDFKNSINYLICNNDYVNNDVEVRDHCHIIGRYRGSAH